MVKSAVKEHTDVAFQSINDTLKRMQDFMDQQSLAITELRSYRVENMATSGSGTPTIGKAPMLNAVVASGELNTLNPLHSLSLRIPKVDFPTFDGSELKDWICKAEQYFELDAMPEVWRVCVAAMYLKGKDLKWYHSYSQNLANHHMLTWGELVREMQLRFGEKAYEDPMVELKELQQDGAL